MLVFYFGEKISQIKIFSYRKNWKIISLKMIVIMLKYDKSRVSLKTAADCREFF